MADNGTPPTTPTKQNKSWLRPGGTGAVRDQNNFRENIPVKYTNLRLVGSQDVLPAVVNVKAEKLPKKFYHMDRESVQFEKLPRKDE